MTKNDKKVYLQGHITVPSDRLDEVRRALPTHITLTRAEEGCIAFEVSEDDAHPGRFNVSEVFSNQAAFDAHQDRTRNSDWFRITQGIPRAYSVSSE
ncbi:putative quinol monooxygenase [uncultured Ruegeria sp.]|uniref:putative quinol monooxygenase n=1 Tax=uncultured Ruegeria sp. TaxID=259304 RepID=UPI002606CD33|nr:putative quinol monooxygenase [uncultured Ruegeria sp.]